MNDDGYYRELFWNRVKCVALWLVFISLMAYGLWRESLVLQALKKAIE